MAKLKVAKGTYALFALLVLGAALGNLSQTGVNALLESAMADLGVSMQAGQWLSTGYMLVMGIAVPLATYLYEKLTVKAYTILSYALFTAGSLLDVVAPEFVLMMMGRIAQAVGVGFFIPAMQTVAMTRFPPGYQATAMGIAGIALGFAPNVGPTLGGLMDTLFGWRSFSFVLFLVSALLLVASLALVRPEPAHEADLRFDKVSFIYSVLAFGGLLLGLSQAGSYGLLSWWFWSPIVVGVVFMVMFILRQKHMAEPFLDLRIFQSKTFVSGLLAASFLFASFIGITLAIPQYVQNVLDGTSLDAGLILLPTVIVTLLINPIAGVLTDKTNPRIVCLVFGTILAIGSIASVFCIRTDGMFLLTICHTIRATGVSGLIGPTMTYMLSGIKGPLMAHASTASTIVRQIAGTFGTAIIVLCITVCQPLVASGAQGPAFPYIVAFAFSALMAVGSLITIVVAVKKR